MAIDALQGLERVGCPCHTFRPSGPRWVGGWVGVMGCHCRCVYAERAKVGLTPVDVAAAPSSSS